MNHSYQHPGIEYANEVDRHDPAMRSLKWAINKELRELNLKKDGIILIYCAHRCNGIKEHEVEIQESRGKYSLFVDNKSIYTAGSLADCVRWAKSAGHLDKDEKIGETRAATAKPEALTKPVIPTKHKEKPADSAADKLKKFLSWKSPSTNHPGWR